MPHTVDHVVQNQPVTGPGQPPPGTAQQGATDRLAKQRRLLELLEASGDQQGQLDLLRQIKAEQAAPVVSEPNLLQRGASEFVRQQRLMAGVPETMLTMATGAAGEVVGGLAGLGTAALEAGGVRQVMGLPEPGTVVERVREAMTVEPFTRFGQQTAEALGEFVAPVGEAITATEQALGKGAQDIGLPPSLAAVAATLPTAVMEAIGVAPIRPLLRGLARRRERRAPVPTPALVDEAPTGLAAADIPTTDAPAPGGQTQFFQEELAAEQTIPTDIVGAIEPPREIPATVPVEEITDAIRKGQPVKLAEAVLPDAAILESAQRLGVDLNPEHYSTSAAFRDVTRALKSKPGSALNANERAALEQLSTSADNLVIKIGGQTDRASVSDSILGEIRTTVTDLENTADRLYPIVLKRIGANTQIDTTDIREFLDQQLADFGGNRDLLATVEKQLFKLTDPGAVLTYKGLDTVRRDIARGFDANDGPYRKDSDSLLRQVYGVLAETQRRVAHGFPGDTGKLYDEANNAVVRRKAIEDDSIVLFGRNAAGSLVPKLRQAGTAITKGDVAPFNKMIQALPEGRRTEVAATVLSEIFSAGSRRSGQMGTGFAAAFESLNRNPSAKNVLFSHLPKESRQRFNDIGRVMTGIVKANARPLSNPSGSAGPIIDAVDKMTVPEKIYTAAIKPVERVPGVKILPFVEELVENTNKPGIQKADALFQSPTFTRALSEAIRGNTARADAMIERTPQFKAWLDSISTEDKASIAALGFIGWLSQIDEQETAINQPDDRQVREGR